MNVRKHEMSYAPDTVSFLDIHAVRNFDLRTSARLWGPGRLSTTRSCFKTHSMLSNRACWLVLSLSILFSWPRCDINDDSKELLAW